MGGSNSKNSKNENFVNTKSNTNNIWYGIHIIFAFLAVFLCFKCNNGFRLGQFLIALIFPEIYAVYMLIKNRGLCLK